MAYKFNPVTGELDTVLKTTTTLGSPGVDTQVPTEKAVRAAISTASNGLQVVAADPASPDEGTLIINSTDNKMKVYYLGTWQELHTFTPASSGIGSMVIGTSFIIA